MATTAGLPGPAQPTLRQRMAGWGAFIDAALRFTWPVILAQFVALGVLLIPQQGQEVLRQAVGESIGIAFLLAALLFSILLWMLTRTIIGKNVNNARRAVAMGREPDRVCGTLDTPKRFGFSAWISMLFLVTIGIYSALKYDWWLIYLSIVGAGAGGLLSLATLKWSARYLAPIAIITFVLLFGAILFPVPLSLWISSISGPYATLFLALFPSIIVLLFVVHVIYNEEWPIVASLIVVLLLGFVWLFIPDYHEIRLLKVLDTTGEVKGSEIKSVTDAVTDWRKNNSGRIMVVVAAAGGGIRAAYWTAAILGKIEDEYADFDKHVFVISAVSGGALGATAFDAALDSSKPQCGNQTGYEVCLKKFLSYDFLSPLLASQLVGDLGRQFDPLKKFGLSAWWLVPDDRATVLELGWEQAWRSTFEAKRGSRFEGAFRDLWVGTPRRPTLLLNGTSAVSGKRLVTGDLALRDENGESIDNPAILPIRVSTAIDNSTRFPLIEPAGGIPYPASRSTLSDDSIRMDYVVDGGYYDNYGAATLLDVLREIPKDLPLVIIQITSDPQVTARLERGDAVGTTTDTACRDGQGTKTHAEDEESGPMGNLDGVYNATMAARSRTGIVYATMIRDSATPLLDPKPGYPRWIQFGMPPATLPLGWSLSTTNQGCIEQLLVDETIKTKIDKLITTLKGR